MNLNFNKALVTGGAGFIGSHLVEALADAGCEVAVIDDLSAGRLENLAAIRDRITFYRGDIRDEALLDRALRGCEVLFHLAAVVSVPWTVAHPLASAAVNETGTLQVLEAARRQGIRRFIGASSCAVYGDGAGNPKKETMAAEPLSPYALQKFVGERYGRLYSELYGLETLFLRYFNVYGPRQDPSSPYSGVISIFMSRAGRGTAPVIYGDGRQSRDFVFVQDAVQANLLAAGFQPARGQVFNIGTGRSTRIADLWQAVQKISGSQLEPVYEAARAGDIRESAAAVELAKAQLDFQPAWPLEKGLEITYDWYKRQKS